MGVTLRHEFDTSLWSSKLEEAARGAADPMGGGAGEQIGELGLNVVHRTFDNEGGARRWPELSDATLIARARGRNGRGKVFRDSSDARAASGGHGLKGNIASGAVPVTARAAKIIEGAKPLIWSGRLLRSTAYAVGQAFVDIGSNLVQAARLWFGYKDITPARNPFDFTPEDNRQILAIVSRRIFGPLTGAR